MRSRRWWPLALLLLATGCPALHPGYLDNSCKANADCFEGERCVNLLCVTGSDVPDMLTPPDATSTDDAPQQQDAAMQQQDAAMQQSVDQAPDQITPLDATSGS